jgi:hypothetical protein
MAHYGNENCHLVCNTEWAARLFGRFACELLRMLAGRTGHPIGQLSIASHIQLDVTSVAHSL